MAPELGILLADSAVELPSLERPEATQLFLMDDGVRLATDDRIRRWADEGADVALCAMDAEARGLRPDDAPHVRFGSQYDHAVMMRDSGRVLALTGAQRSFNVPRPIPERIVLVQLSREAHHSKTAQGLRSAVAYAACNLRVTVFVGGKAASLLRHNDHPPALLRALTTLRGLGHPVVAQRPLSFDLEVSW